MGPSVAGLAVTLEKVGRELALPKDARLQFADVERAESRKGLKKIYFGSRMGEGEKVESHLLSDIVAATLTFPLVTAGHASSSVEAGVRYAGLYRIVLSLNYL